MKKGIIFDLDQTLVDSNIAKSYRSARDWNIVYSLISKFVLYEAYDKVFEFIRDNDLKVGIVSKAPSVYVKKVLNHFNIPFDTVVAYHDVKLQKPNSEGMNLALTQLGLSRKMLFLLGMRLVM
jgi:HAD superfamily hydrolase (TIGR01549 family)